MSEAKFTKGPWRATGTYGDASSEPGCVYSPAISYEPKGNMIASMTGYFGKNGQIANAHLIAAAPELYEALRMAANDLNTAAHFLPDTGLALLETVKQAHAALAKARGEA